MFWPIFRALRRWGFGLAGLLVFAVSGGVTRAGEIDRAIPAPAGQLVLVVAPDWRSSRGRLQRFERESGQRWRAVGKAFEVLLGERGLAWGLGLHAPATPAKREGDRRAPAGVFALPSAFGRTPRALGLPYRLLRPEVEAVDDPASRFYNQIVARSEVRAPDWRSAERMFELPDYELGIVVAHNPRNVPGAGSCIFIHLWQSERRGTAGCTALRPDDLATLARWLDARRQPVLVQLPRSELPAAWP